MDFRFDVNIISNSFCNCTKNRIISMTIGKWHWTCCTHDRLSENNELFKFSYIVILWNNFLFYQQLVKYFSNKNRYSLLNQYLFAKVVSYTFYIFDYHSVAYWLMHFEIHSIRIPFVLMNWSRQYFWGKKQIFSFRFIIFCQILHSIQMVSFESHFY